MNPILREAIRPLGLATAGLAWMSAAGTPDEGTAVRLWLAVVGAVALRAVVTALGDQHVSRRRDRFEAATDDPAPRPEPERPGMVRAARVRRNAAGTSGDLHYRARPELRRMAQARLVDRGLDLDDPVATPEVEAVCGPILWDAVRPNRPEPADRHRKGLAGPELVELIDRLERL